jgi:hypothetical protein
MATFSRAGAAAVGADKAAYYSTKVKCCPEVSRALDAIALELDTLIILPPSQSHHNVGSWSTPHALLVLFACTGNLHIV